MLKQKFQEAGGKISRNFRKNTKKLKENGEKVLGKILRNIKKYWEKL